VARVIGGVVRQALADAGCGAVAILDDGSPEAGFAATCCAAGVGEAAVLRVAAPPAERVEELLGILLPGGVDEVPAAAAAAEAHRLAGRLAAAVAGALLAHPATKTVLLLAERPPCEPLLPLGDLWASQLEALLGAWRGPPEVERLAAEAGGIARLDAALGARFDERRPEAEALALLPAPAADAVRAALLRGRFLRRRIGLVPKLSSRTLGIDLFE
jgi:hypothetical protein